MRTCVRCKSVKDDGEMSRDKYYKDGISNVCKECKRLYYKNNREKVLAAGKARSQKHEVKERRNQLQRERRAKNPELHRMMFYIETDKKKGLDSDIDIDWCKVEMRKPCTYCGMTHSSGVNGLDRIDNSKGHTKENCVPCCRECNQARMDFWTYDEMKEIGKVMSELKIKRLNSTNRQTNI